MLDVVKRNPQTTAAGALRRQNINTGVSVCIRS